MCFTELVLIHCTHKWLFPHKSNHARPEINYPPLLPHHLLPQFVLVSRRSSRWLLNAFLTNLALKQIEAMWDPLLRNIHMLKSISDLERCHNLGINLIRNFKPPLALSYAINKHAASVDHSRLTDFVNLYLNEPFKMCCKQSFHTLMMPPSPFMPVRCVCVSQSF